MTFARLLDRTVTVRPRIVTGKDDRNNDVIADGTPIPGVAAGRELEATDELTEDRDEVDRRWVYFLPAALPDGTPLVLDGYAEIDDDGDGLTYTVAGQPELIVSRRRRGRPHHWELTAERKD